MTPESVRRVLLRELGTLATELDAYPDDDSVWICPPGLPNSAGTLALHLVGNLRHFIGARLGGSGYVRDREEEFAVRDLPRTELRARIDAAAAEVGAALSSIDPDWLAQQFPDPVGGARLGTGTLLLHLVAHTGYHLGQLDYHRRVVTGRPQGVGALAPAALSEPPPV
jgi:hypothetical protein